MLYRTPVVLPGKEETDTIAAAFFYGNMEDGWKDCYDSGGTYYDNDDFTVYFESVPSSHESAAAGKRIELVFGQINNAKIKQIKVADANGIFVNAIMIETTSGRYYFKVGEYIIVQGLNAAGEIIRQQGS